MEKNPVKKRSLLLHSCCGPCSTAVIERLYPEYEITVFYYNPNIMDREEYEKRKETQKQFLEEFNQRAEGSPVLFLEGTYEVEEFCRISKGLEEEPEGGARCERCFRLRLERTAMLSAELGFEQFTTTLSVSPYKNAALLNQIGMELDEEHYLEANFKKRNGYQRSIELSREFGLYRQHYCGCQYAKVIMERQMEEKAKSASEIVKSNQQGGISNV